MVNRETVRKCVSSLAGISIEKIFHETVFDICGKDQLVKQCPYMQKMSTRIKSFQSKDETEL